MQKITFYVETTSVAVWPSISNLTSWSHLLHICKNMAQTSYNEIWNSDAI